MLTGELPFVRDAPGSVMYAHMHEDPPSPSDLNPAVPVGFDAVVARAMAKRPEDRYDSCEELATAARAAASGELGAQVGRSRGLKRFAVVLVLLLLVAAGVVAVRELLPGASPVGPAAAVRPVSGTIDPAYWAGYAYIAQTFPNLLPPTPYGGGYQELTACIPTGAGADDWVTQLPLGELYCLGNSDPVYSVFITCNLDRTRGASATAAP
ncbi:hypothetical protein GFY24_13850 [Nocardia sp. SYP-A9097]|uniref:hypothetical protein n=1 Tax=Nocardia sp. SYP-A9097 TaxID=2663237 RepID=UPI00129C00A8|nr:hypothetical protein [Nocardia sp. SYP-A9097]MRH88516.1 hypothetical protein [Nocardia sp. SYP-A9097]